MTFSIYNSRLKKSAEDHKNVLQRKRAGEEKKAAIPFTSILADKSRGKTASHLQLIGYIDKFGEEAFTKVFLKSQLLKLCHAHGVKCSARDGKKKIVEALIPVMKSCERVPHPHHLIVYQPQLLIDEAQKITMRFRIQL